MRPAFSWIPSAAVFLACHAATRGEPVPVQGTYEARSELAGEWGGRYWMKGTGRHGIIRFRMPEHADTAVGEVEMTFSPAIDAAHSGSTADEYVHERWADRVEPRPNPYLDIRVVQIEANRVRGTIAPYWDPDCDCRAETVFEGQISGNRIRGTFTTRRASSDRRVFTGEWRVERARGGKIR